MKNIIYILLFCPILSYSQAVEIDKAKNIAHKYINSDKSHPLTTLEQFNIDTTITNSLGENILYIFDIDTIGFIMITADYRMKPVVSYAMEGKVFNSNKIIPPVKSFINGIIYDYENLNNNQSIHKEWNIIDNNSEEYSSFHLLSTTWGQGCYYNNDCPNIPGDDNNCDHALVGCVAVALGQIANYWNYPENGSGFIEYNDDNLGYQFANFSQADYDWENMPNQLNYASSITEQNAVSKLLYYVGVASHMNYGEDGSGTYNNDALHAMTNFFEYSHLMQWVSKTEYNLSDWNELILDQLNEGAPIYYSGYSSTGGHAYVIDGYSTGDLFYHNFGWNGGSDAYYYLSNNMYTNNQQALINIIPSTLFPLNSELILNDYIQSEGNEAALGFKINAEDSINISTTIANIGQESFNGIVGVSLTEPGGSIFIESTGNYVDCDVDANFDTSFENMGVSAGNYDITIIFSENDTNFYPVLDNITTDDYEDHPNQNNYNYYENTIALTVVEEMCNDVIWEDNLDDYEVGEIDSQSNDWIGWGANASNVSIDLWGGLYVDDQDDLVRELGDLKYGNGYISFYMLVPKNNGAYFNFLHNYNTSLQGNDWAHEVFFAPKESNEPSYIKIDEQQIEFDVVYDRYVQIKQYFDFNQNLSRFYYNGNLIHSWNINETLNTSGEIKIDGLNLFGSCSGTNCISLAAYDDFVMCGNLSSQEIFGCLDTDGCNYNYLAHTDNGSCVYGAENVFLNNVQNEYNLSSNELFTYFQQGTTTLNSSSLFIQGTNLFTQGTDLLFYASANTLELIESSLSTLFSYFDNNYEFYDCYSCINDIDADGICDELEIDGCTDVLACNFNLAATDDDGACIHVETYYNCLGECLNDSDSDGVCDELEILGCTDFSACNYNNEVTEDNGDCIFPIEYYDCDYNCNNDYDNDGICDEIEIIGCMDPLACNFEIEATDSSPIACNYLTFDLIFYENSFVISSTDTINSPIYTWYFNGELINNVSSSSHIPEENGEYELVIFDTENNCEATNTVGVYGIGLSENFINDIKIHPNPARNYIDLEIKSDNTEKVIISIYDLSSKLIISDIGFELSNHLSTKRINTTDLISGEYIVKIETNVGSVIQKIIISK